jgi:hypothetical protein
MMYAGVARRPHDCAGGSANHTRIGVLFMFGRKFQLCRWPGLEVGPDPGYRSPEGAMQDILYGREEWAVVATRHHPAIVPGG